MPTRSQKIRIVKIVAFVVGLSAMILSLRSHYSSLIDNLGYWGWVCALCHQYPFLSYLFFRNPETPDAVVNIYYLCLQGDIVFNTTTSSCAKYGANCAAPMWGPDGPRSSGDVGSLECTVAGLLENNPGKGYTWVLEQWQKEGFIPEPKSSEAKKVLNFFISYVLPFAMLAFMLIPK